MRNWKVVVGGMITSLIVAVVGVSGNALAYSTIEQKALGYGVWKCYTGTIGSSYIMVGKIKPSQLSSYESIVLDNSEDYVALPTGFDSLHKLDDSDVSCRQLFGGYHGLFGGFGGTFDGLFERAGVDSAPTTEAGKKNFLTMMGYTVDSSVTSSGGECFRFKMTYGSVVGSRQPLTMANVVTSAVCTTDGGVSENSIEVQGSGTPALKFSKSGNMLFMAMFTGTLSGASSVESTTTMAYDLNNYSSFEDLMDVVASAASEHFAGCQATWSSDSAGYSFTKACLDATDFIQRYDYDESAELEYSIAETHRRQNKRTTASLTASNNLLGGSFAAFSDLAFTGEEKYALYKTYLDDFYKVDISCNYGTSSTTTEQSLLNAGYVKIPYYQGGDAVSECYAKATQNSTTKVHGLNENNYFDGTEKSFGDIVGELPQIVDDDDFNIGNLDDITVSEPPTPEATCGNSGGAGSLGWIVCPVLQWLGDAAGDIYTDFLEPSLKVDPVLFNETENAGTKQGWTIFQGIANVLFIIMLLVVIFSQLTGVGIDNYGIKKILPKLIIAAILVNLSYYICVIFVDLSNILGNGLQSLFSNLPTNVSAEVTAEVSKGSAAGATLLSVGLISAMAAGAVWVVWSNPAILLSLLVGALGVLISVVFLFILLAGREAAIVVLTVISPLAFACYMLPNTKKLFDKWWKLGEGLLLVYPIAGLLVGGGNYVSKLLLSSGAAANSFVSALTAMLVGIVPIFFIPTVLKGSFAAMGNLGARISGFGDRLRNGATGRIRNSDMYKRGQTRINSGIDRNGNLTRFGAFRARVNNSRFGRRLGADRRQAAYIAQAKKNLGESEAAGAMLTGALARTGIAAAGALPDSGSGDELGTTFGAGTEGAYYGANFLNSARANDITGMNAAIEAMRSSGMKAKDIAKIVRYAQNHGYYNGIEQNTRAAWMRDISKKYGNDFMATDFELNHFAATGGSGNGGTLGGYGDYARTPAFGIDDVKPEDVLKLSGDSLAGMISAGKIDQGMAQRVMAMNPNMSADKRIMLGALASGSVNPGVNVDQFKADAKALASNRNAASTTIAPSGGETLATLVARWTAPTAQRATVVQEFFGPDDGQIEPVDVRIDHSSGST